MKIYTIGFTKKSAGTFFGLLQKSGAERLVDVRLNNVSQLAGFAKRDDLEYLLAVIWRHGLLTRASTRPDEVHARGLQEARCWVGRLRAVVPRVDCRAADRGSNL